MEKLVRTFLKRRQFLIHKGFQFELMFISFAYILFVFLVIGTYLFLPSMVEMNEHVRGSEMSFLAAERFLYLHEQFWPALLFSFLAIGCHSVFVSHRIAGPLYRFKVIFNSIKGGEVPSPIRLRRRDYLYLEMASINDMLEQLREKLADIQDAQGQLNQSILECKESVSSSSTNEIIRKMEALVGQGKEVEEKLAYFKVK